MFSFIFDSKKPKASTPFADFIRNASASEKKRVFADVLEKATEEQNRVIREAKKA